MSEMKNIVESWRGYVIEQEEEPDEEQVSSNEIENVGQLRTALKNYKIKKTGQGVLTKILRKGVEAIPVAGPAIGAVLDAGELAKSLYGGDLDDKEPLPGLDAMRVNPDVSKIVDDDIEEEFLKVLSQELEKADPETPINDFNTTARLQNFIASKFNNTTVKKESTEKDIEDLEKRMSDLEKNIKDKKEEYKKQSDKWSGITKGR
tara:strand:- start:79 stop:693 length:615 start_codon:yes stop_codon:yes gene_type:complete